MPALAGGEEVKPRMLSENQLKVLRGLAGGTVGGVLAAATSHPFDTIKSCVRNGVFPNISSCAKSTWHNEGIFGFYRGVTLPVLTGGFYKSIIFGLNRFMTNLVTPVGWDHKTQLPLWRHALAAELTVPLLVIAVTPMEKVKVMLQVQGKGGVAQEKTGPISCIRHTWRHSGPMGFLLGYVPTLLSRVIGYPLYFADYQVSKQFLLTQPGFSDSRLSRELLTPMVGGVIAGLLFWTSNYPCDFIKTQLQAAKTKTSVREIITNTY